jgi:PemK-like, MazF-like toxin of type II toxin-antitoxin system
MPPSGLMALLTDVLRRAVTPRSATPPGTVPTAPVGRRGGRPADDRGRETGGAAYPGDFTGVPTLDYGPVADGRPDPGEIVWTWVPYEEDHRRGKDRPVLVIGRDGDWLLGLMLTSRDHDRDEAQEARRGRVWLDIGTGAWDRAGRPSEVRVDRVLRVDPAGVRREGATLDRARFDDVASAVRRAAS